MRAVLLQRFMELSEHLLGFDCIISSSVQARDLHLLHTDVPLHLGDMVIGLSEEGAFPLQNRCHGQCSSWRLGKTNI